MPKAYKERERPIPKKLAARLKTWITKSHKRCKLLFPTSRCNPKLDFLDCLKAVAERANLDKDELYLHKLRAAFAAHCLWAGVIFALCISGGTSGSSKHNALLETISKTKILLLAIGLSLAQDEGCYDGAQTFQYNCSSKVPPCSTSIMVTEPGPPVQEGEDGDFYVVTSNPYCCGIRLQDWTYGGGCQGAELRFPSAREKLAEISKTTDILVADCNHHYFAIETQWSIAVQSSISLEAKDRILR